MLVQFYKLVRLMDLAEKISEVSNKSNPYQREQLPMHVLTGVRLIVNQEMGHTERSPSDNWTREYFKLYYQSRDVKNTRISSPMLAGCTEPCLEQLACVTMSICLVKSSDFPSTNLSFKNI